MKKLQIFVCVLLMLCLAACGNTDSGITTGTSADTKPEVTTEKTKTCRKRPNPENRFRRISRLWTLFPMLTSPT